MTGNPTPLIGVPSQTSKKTLCPKSFPSLFDWKFQPGIALVEPNGCLLLVLHPFSSYFQTHVFSFNRQNSEVNPQAMSLVMNSLLCHIRCFPATFFFVLKSLLHKITRYITTSWKVLNKLLEVFFAEIYCWDMILERHFAWKELCLISNEIWQGV